MLGVRANEDVENKNETPTFANINDDDRISLIRFYDSKSTTHIGYLIATVLGFIGFQNSMLIQSIKIPPAFIYALFLTLGVYFFVRAFYWTLNSTAAFWIKAYSGDYLLKNIQNKGKLDHIQFNSVQCLGASISDYYLKNKYYAKKGYYGEKKLSLKNLIFYIFRIWLGRLLFGILFYPLSLLIISIFFKITLS
jgi:hypothetical protein